MNEPGVWFLLPPTPLLLFKCPLVVGSSIGMNVHSNAPEMSSGEHRNTENKVIHSPPCSGFGFERIIGNVVTGF